MNLNKSFLRNILLFSTIVVCYFVIIYYLVSVEPAKKYEISIYDAYPLIFWISLILNLYLTYIILIYNYTNKFYVYVLMLNILTLNIILYSMPLMRGYFIYGRCDTLRHLGKIKDIIITRYIHEQNQYPAMHILGAYLKLIANLDYTETVTSINTFFAILFGVWYLIFCRIFIKVGDSKLLIPILFTPIFGFWNTLMVGNMLSFMMLPILLYIRFSRIRVTEKNILMILLFSLLIIFHLETTVYAITIFIALDLILFVIRNKYDIFVSNNSYFLKSNVFIFVIVFWMFWSFKFEIVQIFLRGIYRSILIPAYINPTYKLYENILAEFGINTDLIKILLFRYSIVTIFFVISIYILIVLLKKKEIITNYKEKIYLITNYSLLFMFLTLFFIVFKLHFVSFERFLRYIIFFSFPAFYIFIKRYLYMKYKKLIPLAILFFIILASIFSVYISPLTGRENEQVTMSEYSGMEWFFKFRDINTKVYEQKISSDRFFEAIYGTTKRYQYMNIPGDIYNEIEKHYGYDHSKFVGDNFKTKIYLIIDIVGKIFYKYTIPTEIDKWKWTPEDYNRLQIDKTANKIFNTQDLEIFLIEGGSND